MEGTRIARSPKNVQMTNKHLKRQSTSLVTRETNQKHNAIPLPPLGWLLLKTQTEWEITHIGKDVDWNLCTLLVGI